MHTNKTTPETHSPRTERCTYTMPKSQKQNGKKERETNLTAIHETPLPSLTLSSNDSIVPITVHVLPRPQLGRGTSTTWTIETEPPSRIRRGSKIIMTTASQQSGIGEVSTVTDLRRHWVTFRISGSTHPSNIRAPIAWVMLDQLEGYTHANRYFDLPALPHTSPSATSRTTPKRPQTRT